MYVNERELTEDQRLMRDATRAFVNDCLKPYIHDWQREWMMEPEKRITRELLEAADEIGLRTLAVPEEFGGTPLDPETEIRTFSLIAEEIARGDVGFADKLVQCWKISVLLRNLAPRHLQEFWFPRLVGDPTGATQANLIMAASTILARRPRSEFVPGHRLQIVMGSPVTPEVADVFHNEFGVKKLIEGFGMTEAPGAFSAPIEGPQTTGSMGKPGLHPDHRRIWTEARVVDDEGNDVADDQAGELWIKTPTIMQGYYKDPEQTAAAFEDGWFKTGDLVRRDVDGVYAFIARKKDIIRCRGENIAGLEIDRVIGAHPGIAEVAAIGVPADVSEEEVLIAIVCKHGVSLTPGEIKSWCNERLAAFKVPRYVAFVDKLPHTPTHKVAKHIIKRDMARLLQHAIDLQEV